MNLSDAPVGAQLDADALLRDAERETGLDDWGDPWFLRPYRKLIGFINAEAGLRSDSEPPVLTIRQALADRLRLVETLRRHPEILDETLEVPGIIIGWPRGGSTMLQRFLASSPQMTAPYWWEVYTPLAVEGEERGDPAPRQAIAKQAIDRMHDAWPDLKRMHPLDETVHEEEVMLIDKSFLSCLWPCYFWIPSYSYWYRDEDHDKAYQELIVWLKTMQWQLPWRRGRKWMLKSPHHILAGNLQSAMKAFPDARIIMTHRAIADVITSYCSVQSLMMRDYSITHDPKLMGAWSIDIFSEAIRRYMDIRKTEPADRFIDIRYRETMTDPMGTYRRVMGRMGLDVTAEDEAAALAWLEANRRDRHPAHHYRAEDYGVTDRQLADAFAFYADAFL